MKKILDTINNFIINDNIIIECNKYNYIIPIKNGSIETCCIICIALYYIILYCIILYCILLRYIILYCILRHLHLLYVFINLNSEV